MSFASHQIETQERANFHHLWMESFWFGIAIVSTSQFLSVFAIRLGADAFALGLLEAIPAVILMISTWAATWWRSRCENTVQAIMLPSFGRRFTFLLLVFTPFLPRVLQIPWLIFSVSLPAIPQSVAAVINPVMWREAVGDRRLTDLLSRRHIAQHIGTAASGLAVGFWLEQAAFPMNYQIMYAVAFIIVLVSLWHIRQVRVVNPINLETAQQAVATVSPWRSPGFRRVAVAAIITYVGYYCMRPIIPLRLVEELNAGESFMALYGLVRLAASVGVAVIAARVVRHLGNQTMLALALAAMAVEVFVLARSGDLYLALVSAALGGASWTVVSISLYGYLAEFTPPETRSSSAFNQVTYFGMIVGPMLGSALAGIDAGLVTVLLLGVVLRLAFALVMQSMRPASG